MGNFREENALCMELEKNIADESEARGNYYKLLSKYGFFLTRDEIEDIEEIIAEELKHTNLLNAMIQRRNGIIAEK